MTGARRNISILRHCFDAFLAVVGFVELTVAIFLVIDPLQLHAVQLSLRWSRLVFVGFLQD